jgi:hypothetical protein
MAARVLVRGPVHPTALVNGLVTALRDQLATTAARVGVGYRGYPADHPDPLLDIGTEIDALRPAVVVRWVPLRASMAIAIVLQSSSSLAATRQP